MSVSCPGRPAGLLELPDNVDFWFSSDGPPVISLGKMPGAIELTRIFASLKVVAIMRVRWRKAAFELA
jgi:hypothetical protein